MKPVPWLQAEPFRVNPLKDFHSEYGDSFGVFFITRPPMSDILRAIVSDGDYKAAGLPKEFAWEHVSVSLAHRCPSWEEMCFVKSLFWKEEETVIQFHPKKISLR